MSTRKYHPSSIAAKFSQLRLRSLLIASCLVGGNLIAANLVFAASPTPGTVIENQATGSFVDTSDSTSKVVESNIVQVTVAEVAGITITPKSTPAAITGSVANFDFTITNVGNDPTKFFLPTAPSAITGGTAGTLQVVGYQPAGGAVVNLATPINISTATDTGSLSDPTLGGNTTLGSIPAGAAIVVRVPVTVTAAAGSPVTVTLGNTASQPSASNTPYVVGANGSGTNDLYTFDNANGTVTGEAAGQPINGDATGHRQEASATQTVTATSTGSDFGDAPNTYGTLLANNGPRHSTSSLYLGAGVTPDGDGQPNATATGDANDDGITFSPTLGANYSTLIQAGVSNQVQVVSSGAGFVNAWVDYNENGAFDAGEQVLTNQSVVAGSNTLTFTPPNTVLHGPTFARFRLSPTSVASPSPLGSITGGEVEDYQVNVTAPVPNGAACATTGLLNGGFESPPQSSNTFLVQSENNIPGWNTTATDNQIETWSSPYQGFTAFEGNQFAEMNANEAAALFQDIATVPGSTLTYQFVHRARSLPPTTPSILIDTAGVSAGPPGAVVSLRTFSTDSTDWVVYRGTYVVPAGQYITRFQFDSIKAGIQSLSGFASNNSFGNFIDAVQFSVNACVTPISPPTIDLDGNNGTASGNDYQNTFVVGGSAVTAADTDTVITDDKTNITRAIAQLTNPLDGANESLTFDTALAATFGITVDQAYDSTPNVSTTGRITLKGSATKAQYQQVIATLKYANTKASPTMTDRIINVQVIDSDKAISNTAVTTIKMMIAAPVTVSGNVFNDIDTSKIKAASGEDYTAADITAVLLNTSNQVVSSAAVDSTGNYSINSVVAGSYSVKIIKTPSTPLTTGAVIPPADDVLPGTLVATGENLNGVIDGTVDRTLSITVGSSNVTNVNFGVQTPYVAPGPSCSPAAASEMIAYTGDFAPLATSGGYIEFSLNTPSSVGQTGLVGWSRGVGNNGTAQVVLDLKWLDGTPNPSFRSTLELVVGGVVYGTITTLDGINGSAPAPIVYTNGASGNLTQMSPGPITTWTIDLPPGVANTQDVSIRFTPLASGGAGARDDFYITRISTLKCNSPVTVSGTVFHDQDADLTINGTDAGTNAGSSTLTIYAVDSAGKVVDKTLVAANGTYNLSNVPPNSSVKLRLSNDNTVAVGATAPAAPSLPSNWYHTGENLNGTLDPAIATVGDIALTTTTANLSNENFGIRQGTIIAADAAPTVCSVDYRTALNTGVTAAGSQLAVGVNDLNWTAEWITGPSTGIGGPYAPPRPVGPMPAVVVGKLAGPWVNEPANARWISYPFRLSGNSNGVHADADLDGTSGEGNTLAPFTGTSDDVRVKFKAQLTLPSNANTIAISLPVGVAVDNQFVSIKVNGVENLSPTPAQNPLALDYATTKTVNLTQGWQAGVNTIEIIADSGPDQMGFFLGINAATTQVCTNPVTVSGTVFHDQDADLTINLSDAGTNASSSTLTIYAVDTAGKVVDKTLVAANGTYTLSNVPENSSVKLRLSNDNTVAVGATAPTTPSLPSNWYHTGENLNGTLDPAIATVGDIALTTTTANLSNENFGIRQGTIIAADAAPTVCSVDYRTDLNTGVTAAGGQLAVGANDLNWTAEWIAGPAGTHPSPFGTPYAPPRPVGPMPAVVVGNLAPGAWVNEPSNARWISYPFRLSGNGNGDHRNADLDNNTGEDGSGNPIFGTSDTVRLKFTSQITLPSNASTLSITMPIGVAMDNQFLSIKVNGVENLSPVPTSNPQATNFSAFTNVNLTQGWQAGVNTIEVVLDSGQPQAGFILAINAATTQVCPQAKVALVKRITAINGATTNPNDGTVLSTFVDDGTPGNEDNNANWPTNFLKGAINAGKVKPGDTIQYTIYFLNAGDGGTNTVKICDRLTGVQTLKTGTYGTGDLQFLKGGDTTYNLTSASDAGDRAALMTTATAPSSCNLDMVTGGAADTGTLVVDVTGTGNANQPDWPTVVGSAGQGTPSAYGSITFTTTVNP